VPVERLAEVIWRRSEGLPLFAVRLTESLIERGVVRAADAGGWSLTLPIDRLDLGASASMTAVIHGHLERLDDGERQTLDAASVDGPEFGTAILSELQGRSAADVEDQLERIARVHGLIERLGERELAGGLLDVRYRFCHVLYQNHLYRELGSHRLLELHRHVARALLGSSAGVPPSPSRLAFHFERGREFSRAVAYWTEAGDQADRAYAKLEALDCYERAALLLERLPEGERLLRRLVIEHGRGWASVGLGRLEAARLPGRGDLAFASPGSRPCAA
jgi:predicted ATPase